MGQFKQLFFGDMILEGHVLQLLYLQAQEPSLMPRKPPTGPSFAARGCEGLDVLFPDTAAQVVVFLICS